jgi:hypothetical protein
MDGCSQLPFQKVMNPFLPASVRVISQGARARPPSVIMFRRRGGGALKYHFSAEIDHVVFRDENAQLRAAGTHFKLAF